MSNIDTALLNDIGYYFFYFIQYISFFIFSFIGALLREIYNTNIDLDYEFNPHKVISATFVSTFATITVRRFYPEFMDLEITITISFVIGLIGYELFTKLTSLEDIIEFIYRIKNIASITIEKKDKDKKRK